MSKLAERHAELKADAVNMTYRELRAKYGVSFVTIRKWLKRPLDWQPRGKGGRRKMYL